jgi:hypothetical protein
VIRLVRSDATATEAGEDASLHDEEDLDRVHERFGRWIRDASSLEYDQDRLNYRHEIGRRHHREGVEETVHVRFENVTV